MPEDIEKRRKRQREWVKAKRERLKPQKDLEREVNDPKPMYEKFMSWERFKEIWRDKANWEFYIEEKAEFERRPLPMPEPKAYNVGGASLWGDADSAKEQSQDEVKRHHREAEEFASLLAEPEHPLREQLDTSTKDTLTYLESLKKKKDEQQV